MNKVINKKKSLLEIHFAVFLFGMAGLFGKFISLPAMQIVFGRVLFASLTLLIIIHFKNQKLNLQSIKDYVFLLLSGVVLTVHWGAFFYSIQISTVAVGLLTFSTFPVFVTFMEPLFFKEKIKFKNIFIALITFAGVALVIPEYKLDNNITTGALWGVFSGFTFAVLSIMNRKYVKKYSSLVIAFYQNSVSTVLLIPFLFLSPQMFIMKNILLLALLGIVFTAVAHSLFIKGMKFVKVQTASVIACLEPVYGIVFAILLLNEIPAQRVWAGGLIILIS
ncbi:MAG: EamA family transporter, partial [Calditrichia bacterium]|nr:EamA family transporter [Calditrichia bacterium]